MVRAAMAAPRVAAKAGAHLASDGSRADAITNQLRRSIHATSPADAQRVPAHLTY